MEKSPGTCNACGELNAIQAVTRADICVVHRAEDGRAYAWGDVSGNELNPELTLKARKEEMEQFKKHEVYEKVREDVCWAVTGKQR